MIWYLLSIEVEIIFLLIIHVCLARLKVHVGILFYFTYIHLKILAM